MTSFTIKVDLSGTDKLFKRWKRFNVELPKVSRENLDEFGYKVIERTADNSPVWSGDLMNSWSHDVVKSRRSDQDWDLRFTNDMDYASEQEYGIGLPRLKIVNATMRKWAIDKGYYRALGKKEWTVRKHTPALIPSIEYYRDEVKRGFDIFGDTLTKAGFK